MVEKRLESTGKWKFVPKAEEPVSESKTPGKENPLLKRMGLAFWDKRIDMKHNEKDHSKKANKLDDLK